MIRDVKGNILTPASKDDEFITIVCQQVNCVGVMGAGLAKQIKARFPSVFEQYKSRCAERRDNLGTVLYCATDNQAGYVVANLFGQVGFGTDARQTDYSALKRCFLRIKQDYPKATIRIPYRLGCGLAGGDWNVVKGLIEAVLGNNNIEIWHLPE